MTRSKRAIVGLPLGVPRVVWLGAGLVVLAIPGCFLNDQVTVTRTWHTRPVAWSLDGERITTTQHVREDVNFGDSTIESILYEADPNDLESRSPFHTFGPEIIFSEEGPPWPGTFIFPELGPSDYLIKLGSPPQRYWRDGHIDDYPLPAPWSEQGCELANVIPRPDGLQHGLAIACGAENVGEFAVMAVVDPSEPSLVLNSSAIGASTQVQLFWMPDDTFAAYRYADPTKVWFRLEDAGVVQFQGTPDCFYPSTTTGHISPQGTQLCMTPEDELADCTEDSVRIDVSGGSVEDQYWRIQAWGCPDGPSLLGG